jgi:hypothetical protein
MSTIGTRRDAKGFLPRLIRLRDAGRYLGMDQNRFNAEVRPFLTEIPIGIQGIAFDRLEMDAWVDDYRSRNGRPPRKEASWQRELPDFSDETESGESISASQDMADCLKAVERVISQRPSATSRDDSKRSVRRPSTESGRQGRLLRQPRST